MATINQTAELSFKLYGDFIDIASFSLRVSGKTEMVLRDNDGASLEIHGSGFKYAHGEATDGIITSATIRDEEGHLLLRVSHAHIEASQLSADLDQYGLDAFYGTFAIGNDHLTGSEKGDGLEGGYGNDVIKGKGGNDILVGYVGDDVLIGGAGKDTFMFTENWGVDVIKDFEDSGKDQDIIRLQYKSMWSDVDKYQNGDDVVLDFGDGDKLIIRDAHQADITQADFQFG